MLIIGVLTLQLKIRVLTLQLKIGVLTLQLKIGVLTLQLKIGVLTLQLKIGVLTLQLKIHPHILPRLTVGEENDRSVLFNNAVISQVFINSVAYKLNLRDLLSEMRRGQNRIRYVAFC